MSTAAQDALPAIREGLQLVGRSRDRSGEPVWIIYDPLRHSYLELRALAYEILSRWGLGGRKKLIESLQRETSLRVTQSDLDAFMAFLAENQILNRMISPPGVKQPSMGWRILIFLSKLLFIRLRLFRPESMLAKMSEVTEFLFQRWFWITVGVLGVVGVALVSRQWDAFLQGFLVLNEGTAIGALLAALVFSKVIHELGHALTAQRHGCHVSSMGVALIVGIPLAFTDVSDIWRLLRRRDRFLVSAAGILAELTLAVAATWGWLVLPDGPAKTACFMLALVGWISSLIINLNPFLRFDGYYMLSDLLGIRNLQDRSFLMARWAMRRSLLDWDETPPGHNSKRLNRFLTWFGFSVWVVRLGVFLGIAMAAYQMLGKTAGTLVSAAAITVVVFRPIVKEIGEWVENFDKFSRRPHFWGSLAIGLLILIFLIVPQSYQLSLPAVLTPAERQWIFAPRASMVETVIAPGRTVREGEVLITFTNPDLAFEISQSRRRLELISIAASQAMASQRRARQRIVLDQETVREEAMLAGLLAHKSKLTVLAPFTGLVTEPSPLLRPGWWVGPTEPLFAFIKADGTRLYAYVDDRSRAYLRIGGDAKFYPEAVDFPVLQGKISRIEDIPVDHLAEQILGSNNEGGIPVREGDDGELTPVHGLYKVTIQLVRDSEIREAQVLRGTVLSDSVPLSILGRFLDQLYAVFIRESGF